MIRLAPWLRVRLRNSSFLFKKRKGCQAGNTKINLLPLPGLALCPYFTAMAGYDFFGNGQAQARPLDGRRSFGGGLLKLFENGDEILCWEYPGRYLKRKPPRRGR